MQTIRKDELIERIAQRTRLPKSQVSRVVDTALEEIALSLSRGQRVHLHGFGTFDLRHYPARTGVHPRTGERMPYPERYAPSFRSSVTLKRRVRRDADP